MSKKDDVELVEVSSFDTESIYYLCALFVVVLLMIYASVTVI